MSTDSFEGHDLESRVHARGRDAGLELDEHAVQAIAFHARAVLANNDRLHLTTITEPEEFLERHIGESLEGAALLDRNVRGRFVDLGSGTGYPAIPLAAVHRQLDPVCIEAVGDKAGFLTDAFAQALGRGTIWARQVQRPGDFEDATPVRVLTTRAMGNWERILPRVAPALASDGVVMLWAGDAVRETAQRDAWRRLSLVGRHALPGRLRSWIWCFRATG